MRAEHSKVMTSVSLFSLLTEILVLLATKSQPTNAHKRMKLYDTHRTPAACFEHSCGHPQEGALQRIDTSKYYRIFQPMHRYRILNFKNNA
jgi:hypothetical protein